MLATLVRHPIRQLNPVRPFHGPHPLQVIHTVHRRIVRAIQYIHAHVVEGRVGGKAARLVGPGREAEEAEGGAGGVELVAGVAGEVWAEGAVAVEDGGVDGAVEEGEDGVGGGGEEDGLAVGEGEVVAGLEDRARRHRRVKDHDRPLVVVDGSDSVEARRSLEEEVGRVAGQHVAIFVRAAPVVEPERVFDGDGTARVAACGESLSWFWLQRWEEEEEEIEEQE